jgi:YVTN family beta-propeller protein
MNLHNFGPIMAIALASIFGSATGLAQNAYTTNSGSDTLSVINTPTNAVTAKILVGNFPLGVAVSPTGGQAYIPKSSSNTAFRPIARQETQSEQGHAENR